VRRRRRRPTPASRDGGSAGYRVCTAQAVGQSRRRTATEWDVRTEAASDLRIEVPATTGENGKSVSGCGRRPPAILLRCGVRTGEWPTAVIRKTTAAAATATSRWRLDPPSARKHATTRRPVGDRGGGAAEAAILPHEAVTVASRLQSETTVSMVAGGRTDGRTNGEVEEGVY
jgi:hypothetical protein